MLKDAHLLEAALAADCVIISADNKAWKLFTAARAQVKPIKKIEWANPADEEDGLVGWLESGTSPRK
jgi:hypothetical protein